MSRLTFARSAGAAGPKMTDVGYIYQKVRDRYGRFTLFWPMGKLKFEFSLSVSTQFEFYQHQGGTHVES